MVYWNKTYFGEKTLQTNKWFLISSNVMVKATNTTEFKTSGSKQGNPINSCNILLHLKLLGNRPFITFREMYISMLRKDNRGDAWVIMNIRIPERTVEWLEMPYS